MKVLITDVNDLPSPMSVAASGPLRVELKLGKGECTRKACPEGELLEKHLFEDVKFLPCVKWHRLLVAEEAAYTSFYTAADYPISKMLRDPIYVQVNVVDRADPNLVLKLENCWATSSPNSQSLPQWDLLVDGYKRTSHCHCFV